MATKEDLIRELEQKIAEFQNSTRPASTTEEMDWMRSAELAVERLQSEASSEDDENAARGVLAKVREDR